jgi:arylsulfatase A-like enzyme
VALTPNLDRLREESVRFTDFHAAPMCTPTRGQLLTGLDAARNGALNVSSGRTLLRRELSTMADSFRSAGYRTGLFGKWHLGDNYPYRPQDRGFEESVWFPSSHINSLPDYWNNDYFDDVYCHNGTRERSQGYCTEVFFRHAEEWIEDRAAADKPFLAYLPTNAPHAPLWVPPADREAVEEHFHKHEPLLPELTPGMRTNIIRFLAMIRNVDTHVGDLLELLDRTGLAENTILIFMTDNGSTFGPTYYNAGMRGAKCSLWEGGHRVPCFIRWPAGEIGEPRDIAGLSEVQDILPTLADLCSIELPHETDGISLRDCLQGSLTPSEDRMLIVNYSRMPSNLDYPSPDSPTVVRREGAAVLWRRWRLLEEKELYDLDADPEQSTNVIDEYPQIAARMQAYLESWWDEVEAAANEQQSVIIGSAHENPSMLSACEWADVFVDQQKQVRLGVHRNSFRRLEVAEAGEYTFELRRWPEESGLAITAGCPALDVTDGRLEAGEALPITAARLFIQGQTFRKKLRLGDTHVSFSARLSAGSALLHTWFDDARDQPVCGAYYVYVTKK